ncbi:hypothetical protein [Streptomyces sp. NPDC048361]|uniref:hypothetical protein n=1 Tax=Streptomyces sp. NPDC048361 TaxID=3154720 RepID=UPI00341C4242
MTRTAVTVLSVLAVVTTLSTTASASADTDAHGSSRGDGGHVIAGPRNASGGASVTGSGEFVLPYYKDDDVRSFTFDAASAPFSKPLPGIPTGLPTDARGTVKVLHYGADQHITVTAEGHVDCLVTGPNTATLTAVIDKVSPGGPDWVGKRLGFSVYDGGKDKGHSRDRVGFSWDQTMNLMPGGTTEAPEGEVGTCMAPAPNAPVTKGGYTVRHAELPPFPTP